VPFFVWHLGTGPPPAGWGETVDVSTSRRLADAFRDLKRRLDQQRIVWIDGIHLPQEIQLAPDALGRSDRRGFRMER
jgi:hypothetical protein